MITLTLPESCGNAVRLYLSPPEWARSWRVRRNLTADFTSAPVIYEGTEAVFIDTRNLENEVKVFYQVEYLDANSSWVASNTASVTPAATYEDYTTDVVPLLRERLEAGLMEEVRRGSLFNDLGYIQVLTAPPSLANNLSLPLVTITLENEAPEERSIGDVVDDEFYDDDGEAWVEQAGWLASVNLSITGWSFNPDERITLRQAIRRVLIANFTVFADKGILLPHLTLSDADAVSGEFDVPLYMVNGQFQCLAPIRIGLKSSASVIDTITEVSNG